MASDPEQVGATTTRTSGKRSSNVAAERVSATAAGTSTEGPGKKYRAGGKDAGGKQSATPRRALPGDDPLAPQRTRWLADAVGGSGALADMLGVSRSQTTRWASGQERPGVESAPLLIDLEHVLARVRLVWAEPAATTWMTSANAHLSGARPVDVLRTRGPGPVLEALDAGAWGGAAQVLVYRVFPYLETAAAGEPGNPLYEHHPQRFGRIDHPDYYVWYLSRFPEAAVGETFGNLAVWDPPMFEFPQVSEARRALGVFELPDDLRVLDLDDPAALLERRLRPTSVVVRNLAVTQRWGHDIWNERDPHDAVSRRWQAVQWWSYHCPSWPVLASWERPEFVRAEHLDLTHPAVVGAARTLCRVLG